jgi:hypothetical protein
VAREDSPAELHLNPQPQDLGGGLEHDVGFAARGQPVGHPPQAVHDVVVLVFVAWVSHGFCDPFGAPWRLVKSKYVSALQRGQSSGLPGRHAFSSSTGTGVHLPSFHVIAVRLSVDIAGLHSDEHSPRIGGLAHQAFHFVCDRREESRLVAARLREVLVLRRLGV